MLIEKQPMAAVPLAIVVAAAASALPPDAGAALWRAVLAELNCACCYTVPCFPPRRDGQTIDEWKMALGYRDLAPRPAAGARPAPFGREAAPRAPVRLEAKDKYYNRTIGFVTLYAALLGADAYLDFDLGESALRPSAAAGLALHPSAAPCAMPPAAAVTERRPMSA